VAWAIGDQVLYRYGRDGIANFVRLGGILNVDAEGLTIWVEAGSPQVELVLPDGRDLREVPLEERFDIPRVRRHSTWRGPGIVMFAPAQGDWSIWWFFTADGSFAGWYGNLESPRIRWERDGTRGIDTCDRALDVWVEPDRATSWKDEDEFAILTGRPGRWTAAAAPAIRADGEHLMALAAAGAAPFDGRWTDFRPDPQWTVPAMPAIWDVPHLAVP
jgi:hypothetical protein